MSNKLNRDSITVEYLNSVLICVRWKAFSQKDFYISYLHTHYNNLCWNKSELFVYLSI